MNRAERRENTKVKQKNRIADIKCHAGMAPLLDDERSTGHLKDGHYGCGCGLCKPTKARRSDRRLAKSEMRQKTLKNRYLDDENA